MLLARETTCKETERAWMWIQQDGSKRLSLSANPKTGTCKQRTEARRRAGAGIPKVETRWTPLLNWQRKPKKKLCPFCWVPCLKTHPDILEFTS